MSAERSFRADLARDARHFRGEPSQLIHHRIDRVFQLKDFAANIDRDFLGQVALGHGRGHVGNVAHLSSEVAGHEIDAVRQILPRTGDTAHFGLSAKFSVRTNLAGHARYFRRERAELVHHGVDSVLQLQYLALDIDRDFFR